jgi:hypothetical protein
LLNLGQSDSETEDNNDFEKEEDEVHQQEEEVDNNEPQLHHQPIIRRRVIPNNGHKLPEQEFHESVREHNNVFFSNNKQRSIQRNFNLLEAVTESKNQKIFRNLFKKKEKKRHYNQINNLQNDTECIARKFDATDMTIKWDQKMTIEHQIKIGLPNQNCAFCGAIFWNEERNTKGEYTKCCQQGEVALFPNETTTYMAELFSGISPESKLFLKYSRWFNTQVSFASIKMEYPNKKMGGIQTVVINDTVIHKIGSVLLPSDKQQPKFQQIFFHSEYVESEKLKNDCSQSEQNRAANLTFKIRENIRINNRYVQFVTDLIERFPMQNLDSAYLKIGSEATLTDEQHPGTINKPKCLQVAAIVISMHLRIRK